MGRRGLRRKTVGSYDRDWKGEANIKVQGRRQRKTGGRVLAVQKSSGGGSEDSLAAEFRRRIEWYVASCGESFGVREVAKGRWDGNGSEGAVVVVVVVLVVAVAVVVVTSGGDGQSWMP